MRFVNALGPLLLLAAASLDVSAQETQFSLSLDSSIHPWKDDAALHDVELLGTKVGWAVGDHGAIWKTTDGGQSWSLLQTPVDCSLRSVCFLTKRIDGNQVGTSQIAWVAGRGTRPYAKSGYGVILKTTDGGNSWITLGEGQNLPPVNYVRFFGAQEGIAVGEASPAFPTGVLTTADGGKSWQPAPGQRTAGWHGAAFTEIHDGIVVGPRGRIALVAGVNVAPPRGDTSSLRRIRAVASANGLSGWAVGDGATVLKTSNGGVSWESMSTKFRPELSRFADFTAVTAVDDFVWLSGSPGGCIWHSRDGGVTWTRQVTGQSAPIHAIKFSTAKVGCAVGEFGSILMTTDGGATWNQARSGRRRAAVLAIHTRLDRVPFGMLAKQAGEQGFRSVALVVPRRDTSTTSDLSSERQLHDAVTTVGGNAAELGWRLPIALPETDRSIDALTSEWQKHTEGRLVEVVVSNLTAAIRTWRPSIVVVEEAAENDAAAALILDAVKRSVSDAADPTRFIEHRELAGLAAWKVDRIFVRTSTKTRAGMTIDPYDVLPRLGTTVEAAASAGRSKLLTAIEHAPQPEPFVPLETKDDRFTLVTHRDFWTGISLSPGSDARRPQLPFVEGQLEAQQELAIRQRNFRGISEKFIDDPRKAAQLVAEIRSVVHGMPDRQAALQIAHLANDYRKRHQWDLAEATLIELIDRFPNEAVAAEGMLWLLHLWSSDEMAWHRSRSVSIGAAVQKTSRKRTLDRIQNLLEAARQDLDDPLKTARNLNGDPLAELELESLPPAQNAADWRAATTAYWRRQAIEMGKLIRRRLPEVYPAPEVAWPLASVLRRSGHARISESIYRQHTSLDSEDPLGRIANGEIWLAQPVDEMPSHVSACTWATIRPTLDGVLGDECWLEAREIRLTSQGNTESGQEDRSSTGLRDSYPSVMLAHDEKFLYLAASLPRTKVEGGESSSRNHSPPPVQFEGRTHDADLTGFDRLKIQLDTDRDYATAYEIEIDERGQVRESCWEDSTWNPQMWVYVDSADDRWRIELAIPFSELEPAAPRRHSAWGVSISRTIPHTERQRWPATPETAVNVSSGILQFR